MDNIFKKEKIGVYDKLSNEMLCDVKMSIGQIEDDFVKDHFTGLLEAYIFTHTTEIQEITYYPPRQGFWDWLFRRYPKPFKVNLKVKDVLKKAPICEGDTFRLYETKIIEE